jgi:excisionase family DNA binding protein
MRNEPVEELLTPAEVGQMFRVSPKTVTRWARSGRISAVRTLGGHRRFRADEIRGLLGQFEGKGDLEPDNVAARAPHPDA